MSARGRGRCALTVLLVTLLLAGGGLVLYGVPAPSSERGSVAPPSSGASPAKIFAPCPPSCPIKLISQGLKTGSTWGVAATNVSNGSEMTTTNSTLSFNVTNGTYDLLILGPSGFAVTNGSPIRVVNVSGSPVNVTVDFARTPTATLTLRESGLATGTVWCWTLANALRTCSNASSSKVNDLTRSAYPVSVAHVPGYALSPPAPSEVNVTGGSTVVHLRFVPYVYGVVFVESGLPNGSRWSVEVASNSSHPHREVRSSTGGSVAFNLSNGSYTYRLTPKSGYHWLVISFCPPHCNGSGNFEVSGGAQVLDAQATQVVYSVTFSETGLSAAQVWGISLNSSVFGWHNRTLLTNGTNLTFSGVPNGSYRYTPAEVTGYHVRASGHLGVHGSSASVTVAYAVSGEVPFPSAAVPRRPSILALLAR